MAQITRPPPPGSSKARTYPHVSEIKDPAIQASLRLLWDRVYSVLEAAEAAGERLDQHDADVATLTETLAVATQAAAAAQREAEDASARASAAAAHAGSSLSDGGQGEQGCASSGATGHVLPDAPQTPVTVGQIVCGVGKEFPALLLPVANDAARIAQRIELLGRMIWHLQLAGFNSSYYPGSPQNMFVLLIDIGAIQYAYRVITYNEYPEAIETVMVYAGQTPGATTVPDGGIAD